ncbi:MAG: methyltransferase domain-containing protein [Candidatus Omnitrophica bacterium]|nr:methyltransferase domain-containing protein [Candidatus Omnitrophota bacterium]
MGIKPEERGHYLSREYDTKERFASYWHQADETLKRNPRSVLVVGSGGGFLEQYLEKRGVDVTTADIDPALSPDITADVRKMPLGDESFDVSVCFEVLEHIEYEDFTAALKELGRLSRQWVIISIPEVRPVFRVFADLPIIGWFRFMIPKFQMGTPEHTDRGMGHYWNIGEKGYSLDRIRKDISASGFMIESTYRVFENPLHRFFVLKKVAK